MIFFIPIAILIALLCGIIMTKHWKEGANIIIMPCFFLMIISGFFVFMSLGKWLANYYDYSKNKATVSVYEEAVNIKTLELEETIGIQKTQEIFQNKFSDKVTVSVNMDDPIRATQEYLQDIQEQRIDERNAYIQAKKDIIAYENSIFGLGIY